MNGNEETKLNMITRLYSCLSSDDRVLFLEMIIEASADTDLKILLELVNDKLEKRIENARKIGRVQQQDCFYDRDIGRNKLDEDMKELDLVDIKSEIEVGNELTAIEEIDLNMYYTCGKQNESQNEGDLFCYLCCKSFSTTNELEKHQQSHNEFAPMVTFISKKNEESPILKPNRHKVGGGQLSGNVSVKEEPNYDIEPTFFSTLSEDQSYSCNQGPNKFDSVTSIKNSVKKPKCAKVYPCDQCPKIFTFLANLKRHARSHTGEKPYQCSVCNKCFGDFGHLKRHIKIHTGEMDFKCNLCPKEFNQSGALKRHIENIH